MVARLRVSTSGTGAVSDDYANGVPTAGTILYSGGAGAAPTWGNLPQSSVAQTLFVDGVNFSASADGSFTRPFQTIQQAVNRASANGWADVCIIVAPATYADPVLIPLNVQNVSIEGWSEGLRPIIGGDITVTSLPAGWSTLTLCNLLVLSASIATAAANQDLAVTMRNVECAALLAAFNLDVVYQESRQNGNITVGGRTSTTFDGWSWAQFLNAAPTVTAATWDTLYRDAGHDVYQRALTINGVAIGAVGFVSLQISTGAWLLNKDHVSVKVMDPSIQDFICGVHGAGPVGGQVTFWLMNLSRVSTNFNEAIEVLVHHNDMVQEPTP